MLVAPPQSHLQMGFREGFVPSHRDRETTAPPASRGLGHRVSEWAEQLGRAGGRATAEMAAACPSN